MRFARRLALAAALVLATSQPALAGAPLKGVDVKLGKNPGGSVASRTTDAAGRADFGVWPKGDYTLSLSAPPGSPGLHLVVTGPSAGPIEREVDAGGAEREAALGISLNGATPLEVTITATDRPAAHGGMNGN
jgi:hypothetical protein